MSIAADLLAMRDYIDTYGFSSTMGRHRCPRCFVGAAVSTIEQVTIVCDYLVAEFGINVEPSELDREGWDKPDALAVLEIAADCAKAEGK